MNQLSDRDRALSAFRVDELPADIRCSGNQAIDDLAHYLTSLFDGDTDVPHEHPYFLEVLDTMRMGPEWMDRLLAYGYERTSVKRFLGDVASAVKKNPLYVVLASDIVATADWRATFFPAESEQTRADLKRAIMYSVLLDMVAHACMKEPVRASPKSPPTVAKRLYDHFATQRKEIDWKPYCNSFIQLKMESVNVGFAATCLPYKENYRRPAQGWEDGDIVSANILEAVLLDVNNGSEENAYAGSVLMRYPTNRAPVDGLRNDRSKVAGDESVSRGILLLKAALPRQWNNLYSSWNAAFVSGGFSNWIFACPKLLNPTVAGTYHTEDEGLFLIPRVYDLWFHVHWILFDRARRKSKEPLCANWQNAALTSLWGGINKAAARSYELRVQEILSKHHPTLAASAAIQVDFERIWVMTKLLCYATGTSKALNLDLIQPQIIAMIDKYQPPSTAHRGRVWLSVCWGAMMSVLHSCPLRVKIQSLVAAAVVLVAMVILWRLRCEPSK